MSAQRVYQQLQTGVVFPLSFLVYSSSFFFFFLAAAPKRIHIPTSVTRFRQITVLGPLISYILFRSAGWVIGKAKRRVFLFNLCYNSFAAACRVQLWGWLQKPATQPDKSSTEILIPAVSSKSQYHTQIWNKNPSLFQSAGAQICPSPGNALLHPEGPGFGAELSAES